MAEEKKIEEKAGTPEEPTTKIVVFDLPNGEKIAARAKKDGRTKRARGFVVVVRAHKAHDRYVEGDVYGCLVQSAGPFLADGAITIHEESTLSDTEASEAIGASKIANAKIAKVTKKGKA